MMMSVTRTAALICMLGFFVNSHAAPDQVEVDGKCVYPDRPSIVNGRSATEAEMLSSQRDVKEYLALGNEFLECLEQQEQKRASTDEEKAKFSQVHNAVVDDMNAVAELFNAAIRAYNGRNR